MKTPAMVEARTESGEFIRLITREDAEAVVRNRWGWGRGPARVVVFADPQLYLGNGNVK